MPSYIPDGWTKTGYIAQGPVSPAGEVAYDALEFTYRPSTRLENIKVDAEINIASRNSEDPESNVKAEMIACEFIAKRIVSWDLKSVGVHEVPVSGAAMGRMHPDLFSRLYKIVRGKEFSDKKPVHEEQRDVTIQIAVQSDGDQLKN